MAGDILFLQSYIHRTEKHSIDRIRFLNIDFMFEEIRTHIDTQAHTQTRVHIYTYTYRTMTSLYSHITKQCTQKLVQHSWWKLFVYKSRSTYVPTYISMYVCTYIHPIVRVPLEWPYPFHYNDVERHWWGWWRQRVQATMLSILLMFVEFLLFLKKQNVTTNVCKIDWSSTSIVKRTLTLNKIKKVEKKILPHTMRVNTVL